MLEQSDNEQARLAAMKSFASQMLMQAKVEALGYCCAALHANIWAW